MRRALLAIAILLILGAGWIYLFTGTPPWGPRFTPKNANITSIELLWGGTSRTIRDSNQCAEVLRIMHRARKSPVATTPLFGNITFYYADGSTNRFFLSPAGRFFALEISSDSDGYAISMHEMLHTFENAGLLVENGK